MYLIFIALISLSFLTGCERTQKTTAVEFGNEHQILHVGNAGEPQELDPHLISGLPEFHIETALFEGLTSADPKTLEALPGVAERWDVSEDGRTYTFYLRDNARWSNEDSVVADDFVYAYQRILNPKLGSQYATMLYVIEGANEYHTGKTSNADDLQVRALDKHTLQIRLVNPTPYFLKLLYMPYYAPLHRASLESFNAFSTPGTGWTRPGSLISNGPFKLKSWVINCKIVVERNPHYWNAPAVKLNEIHFYPITDRATEERMFINNELHSTDSAPENKVQHYRRIQAPYFYEYPTFSNVAYDINCSKPALKDPRVRLALSLAVDRDQLTSSVIQRSSLPAFCLVPPGIPNYHSPTHLRFDVPQAKALLAEAGYPEGKDFPTLELLYNNSDDRRRLAEAVQQMWLKNLGIKIKLVSQEWKVFLESRAQRQYDICRGDWIGDYLDANTFLEIYASNNLQNDTGWKNYKYDDLLKKAAASQDKIKRLDYLQQAEAIAIKESPVIPLYFPAYTALVQPSVHGWYPNLLSLICWQYIHLADKNYSETKALLEQPIETGL